MFVGFCFPKDRYLLLKPNNLNSCCVLTWVFRWVFIFRLICFIALLLQLVIQATYKLWFTTPIYYFERESRWMKVNGWLGQGGLKAIAVALGKKLYTRSSIYASLGNFRIIFWINTLLGMEMTSSLSVLRITKKRPMSLTRPWMS